MAPVPVSKLTCDGDTYKCTANLVRNVPIWWLTSSTFICPAGLGWWKVGSTVGHRRLPPEPLLSSESRAYQVKCIHRRVVFSWWCDAVQPELWMLWSQMYNKLLLFLPVNMKSLFAPNFVGILYQEPQKRGLTPSFCHVRSRLADCCRHFQHFNSPQRRPGIPGDFYIWSMRKWHKVFIRKVVILVLVFLIFIFNRFKFLKYHSQTAHKLNLKDEL